MNIFTTSPNINTCSEHLDDKRLNKMILETAQILSTVVRLGFEKEGTNIPEQADKLWYKKTHVNHPAVKWAMKTPANFMYLVDLLATYSGDYHYRFGKLHATSKRLAPAILPLEDILYAEIYREEMTELPVIVEKEFQELPIFLAYQAQLNKKWNNDKYPPKWTNHIIPHFYDNQRKDSKIA